MAKDPAFLFYPNDWIGGTMGMTFEEKGAYMELLILQFNRGHMTSHMIGQAIGQNWDNVKDKFKKDAEGKWFNERLDLEKENRRNFTLSRRNNLKGANQYTDKKAGHKAGHMTSHMEDVNEDEDIDQNEIRKCIEFVGITEQWILTEGQIKEYWRAFLIHSKNEVYHKKSSRIKHFRDWLKKQKPKIYGTHKPIYSGKSAGANELTEQLAAKLAARGTADI